MRAPTLRAGARGPILLQAVAGIGAALAVLPLVYLVIRAGEGGRGKVEATLLRRRTLDLALRSLELAGIVTALCLVIGVTLAWLVTRTDLPFRRVVGVLVALPLALPSYVSALAWIGYRPGLAGRTGSILVLTTVSYPYVYLPTVAALRRCDPALEDAARTLGHRRWSVFRRVLLPQVRPAAVGGCLLVGLYALSDFTAVATMRYPVLTQQIYQSYRASFDRTPAAILGCVLAALTVTVVAIEGRTRRRNRIAKVGAGAIRTQPVVALGPLRWPALAVPLGVVATSLAVPAWGLRRWFDQGRSRAKADQWWDALGHTFQTGALGALAVVVLATPIAYLLVRHPGPVPRTAERAAYAGHALPGLVIGLSLVFFGIRWAKPIYQTVPLLILAYVVLFLSLGLGSIQASFAQIPRGLEDAARTLGRSATRAWCSVTLRLAAPGIGAAATLVFLTVMKELPATLFLRPTSFDTLATRMWGHMSSQSFAAAAPYAVTIVVVAALPTAILSLVGQRRGER